MNNNLHTARGYQGLFSTAGSIAIGDPYEKKKENRDSRFGGKQFNADFPKGGIAGALPKAALFSREYPSLFIGEKYVDRTMYIKSQPPEQRKKGFYSGDAMRRDEFTLDIETSKWRERISTEMMFAERARAMQEAKMSPEERAEMEALASASKEPRWTHAPKYLFDLGKEVEGGVTPYDQKYARDTWYSMQRVKSLNGGIIDKGTVMLSSDAVGVNLKGYSGWSKPEFARQPVIRDNFFRSTGVLRSVY